MDKTRNRENNGDLLDEKLGLLKELEFLKKELQRYEELINLMENDDLIESYIYEYKAVELRYGYFIKLARDKNINVEYIERCL